MPVKKSNFGLELSFETAVSWYVINRVLEDENLRLGTREELMKSVKRVGRKPNYPLVGINSNRLGFKIDQAATGELCYASVHPSQTMYSPGHGQGWGSGVVQSSPKWPAETHFLVFKQKSSQ